MTKYAIERDNAIVNHIVFVGKGLYRKTDVIPLVFNTTKKAKEVAEVLDGEGAACGGGAGACGESGART
jgi:hypothetical protein